jgi:hypothetical protein
MGCNMMGDASNGDFAWSAAQDAQKDVSELMRRVAELEQALCGVCQTLERDGLPSELQNKHPLLQQCFDKHKRQPGCELHGR